MATTVYPHDALCAALEAIGVRATTEDTGGGCVCVIAPTPEGGELAARFEDDEWLVAISTRAGGCEWVGTVPTVEALIGWVYRSPGRAAGTATSRAARAAAARDAARPGSSEREAPAETA